MISIIYSFLKFCQCRSSSCESGRGMSETWSWSSSSMSVSDLGTPSSASEHLPTSHLDNIGGRIDILQYAESEWHGNTERAETIRKVCIILPTSLDVIGVYNLY